MLNIRAINGRRCEAGLENPETPDRFALPELDSGLINEERRHK